MEEIARLRSRLALLEFKQKAAITDGYSFGATLAAQEIAYLRERLRDIEHGIGLQP